MEAIGQGGSMEVIGPGVNEGSRAGGSMEVIGPGVNEGSRAGGVNT